MAANYDKLKVEVIDSGLCTGCGTCTGVCAAKAIEMDYTGDEILPHLVLDCVSCGLCVEYCPGKDIPLRDLDKKFLGRERNFNDEHLGIYLNSYRGWSKDPYIRQNTSSGGIVTSLAKYALDSKRVDAVIMSALKDDEPWKGVPFIATTSEDVDKAARSAPVMVPVNDLVVEALLKRKYKRIGVVGLPCHIHGLRKLQAAGKPKRLAEGISFMIGLYCASTYYWEGVRHLIKEFTEIDDLSKIVKVDYRGGKYPGGMYVLTSDNRIHYIAGKHDYTWHFLGAATYKRDRCLMCVDFSAELADISCGDIFQKVTDNPKIVSVLTRTDTGQELFRGAKEAGFIDFEHHPAELITASGMGWEAKRHAGMYRLLRRGKQGWPVPDYQYDLEVKMLARKLSFPS